MKNKIIISSILTIAMCFSLIAGSTFALFTSESKVDVSVSSATVSVTATPTELKMSSTLGTPLGSATQGTGDKANELTLENFVPGDYATFKINVVNGSNVTINYRTIISVTEDDDLFAGLVITIDNVKFEGERVVSSWKSLNHTTTNIAEVSVKIALPEEAGDEYQNKSCKISYMVEAVQGNTIPVSSFEELVSYKGTDGNYTVEGDIVTNNMIYFGESSTAVVNLTGTVTSTDTTRPVFTSQKYSDLTINADNDTIINCEDSKYAGYLGTEGKMTINGGNFQLGETAEGTHFHSQNDSLLVINDGIFISNDANSTILYCINGDIEVNGGFFQNTANPNQALISCGNNLNYANNQKVTLRGGTFVNWNPMSSAFARPYTNPDVPAIIVLAEGYQMISETQANGDVWYMVVPIAE